MEETTKETEGMWDEIDHPRLRVGSEWQDTGLVFATGKGTPVQAQNIINRHFKPLVKRAGLPDIRWHDLRHTYATLLLARGTHSTYVQKSLGHPSVQLALIGTPTGCPAWEETPPKE